MKKILISAVLVIFIFCSCSFRAEKNDPRTISVTGKGTATLDNEKGVISLSVVTRSANILAATEDNAKRMEAVRNSLEAIGVEKESISTSSFYMQQESSYSNGRKVLGQYVVSNGINIIVPSIEKTGQIIDEAVKSGANQFNSISFSAGETSDAEKQARILALRDAERKAVTLASTSGLSVGKIISIKEQPAIKESAAVYSAKAEAGSTNVSAGKTSVSVNVEVVYEIQ